MDRQSLVGLSLIFLIVMAWAIFFPPEPPPPATPTDAPADSSAPRPVQPPAAAAAATTMGPAPAGATASASRSDSAAALTASFGQFAPAVAGQDRALRVVTEKLDVVLSTRGGQIRSVNLVGFNTNQGQPLAVMPDGPGTKFTAQFRHGGRIIDTKDLHFAATQTAPVTLKGSDSLTLTLRAQVAEGRAIEQIYTFSGNRYHVGYRLRLIGLGELITNNDLQLHTSIDVPRTERNAADQRNNTTVFYNYSDAIERLDPLEQEETISKTEQGNIKWLALKSMFFTVGLLPRRPFEAITVTNRPVPAAVTLLGGKVKSLEAFAQVPYGHAPDESTELTLYLGPNDFTILQNYPDQFEDQMEMGWTFIGWINKYIVLNVFKTVEGWTSNYGLVILALAIFIKLLISPLTYRSYLSNARMQVVNNLPEVKELDEKYKEDPLALQNKKMAFYQSAGISPLAGCIPALLQLPILIAMFNFFPKSIELRQQPFAWAPDLSSYDSILDFGFSIPGIGDHLSGFAILMTLSQLAYTYISQQGQTFSGPNASLKYLGYIMPVIFFAVLNSYSSGLSYYYLLINLLTIGQTFAIKAFINEEKIKEKIHHTRQTRGTKPAKASGFARWLEGQQKKQEALLRERRQLQQGGRKGKK